MTGEQHTFERFAGSVGPFGRDADQGHARKLLFAKTFEHLVLAAG